MTSNEAIQAESQPSIVPIDDIKPEYHSAAPDEPSLAELRQRAQIALNRVRLAPSTPTDAISKPGLNKNEQVEAASIATVSTATAIPASAPAPLSKPRLNFIWGAPAGAVTVSTLGEESKVKGAADCSPSHYQIDDASKAQAVSDAEQLATAARISLRHKRAAAASAQTTIVDAKRLQIARESVKKEADEEAERERLIELEQRVEQDQATGKDALDKPAINRDAAAGEKAEGRDRDPSVTHGQTAHSCDRIASSDNGGKPTNGSEAAALQDKETAGANGKDAGGAGTGDSPVHGADEANSESSRDGDYESEDDSSDDSSSSDNSSGEEDEEDPTSEAAYLRKKRAISKLLGEEAESEDNDNNTDLDTEATVQAMVDGADGDGGDDEDDEEGGGKSGNRNGPMTKNEITYQELLTGGEAKSAKVDGVKIATELPFTQVPAELKGSLRYLGTVQAVIQDEPSVLVVRQDLEFGGGFVDSDSRQPTGNGAVSGGAGAGSYRVYSRSTYQRGAPNGKPEAYAVLDTGSLLCSESGRVISTVSWRISVCTVTAHPMTAFILLRSGL